MRVNATTPAVRFEVTCDMDGLTSRTDTALPTARSDKESATGTYTHRVSAAQGAACGLIRPASTPSQRIRITGVRFRTPWNRSKPTKKTPQGLPMSRE